MSWEHGTCGWEAYENFVSGLKISGIEYAESLKNEAYVRGQDMDCFCYCGYGPEGKNEHCPCCDGTCGHRQNLRLARFTTPDGKPMVVEEYLAVKDCDCDGESHIAISVYEEGHRPELTTLVLEAR